MSTGWKKWECPPDMFTVEEKLKTLQLTEDQADRMAMSYYEAEMKRATDKDTRQKWAALFVKTRASMIKKDLKEGFVEDFQLWLQGRSKYCQPMIRVPVKQPDGSTKVVLRKATPWGNKGLLHLPEVQEWLKKPVLNRDRVIKKLAFLELGPLRTIEDCWLYYKYITRGVAVDGDVIKEQRSYNVFDYMENRPTKLDAYGNLVEDPDYTPLQIQNPSMKKFSPEKYERIMYQTMQRAAAADFTVTNSSEYDDLMPGDKLLVLGTLAEAGHAPIDAPVVGGPLLAFVEDLIEKGATAAKAPTAPIAAPKKKEKKEESEEEEEPPKKKKPKKKKAPKKKKEVPKKVDKKKVSEETVEKAKKVAEAVKKIDPVKTVKKGVLAEKKKEVVEERDKAKEAIKKTLEAFKRDPTGKTMSAEARKAFSFYRLKMEAYRDLTELANTEYVDVIYDLQDNQFKTHTTIKDKNTGEELSPEGFMEKVNQMVNDPETLEDDTMTRIAVEAYFERFIKNLKRHYDTYGDSDAASIFAIDETASPEQISEEIEESLKELYEKAPFMKNLLNAIDISDRETFNNVLTGAAKLSVGGEDFTFIRAGLETIQTALEDARYVNPFMMRAGKFLKTVLRDDDKAEELFKKHREAKDTHPEFLNFEGAARAHNILRAVYNGDLEQLKQVSLHAQNKTFTDLVDALGVFTFPKMADMGVLSYKFFEKSNVHEFEALLDDAKKEKLVEVEKAKLDHRIHYLKSLMHKGSEYLLNDVLRDIKKAHPTYKKTDKWNIFDEMSNKAEVPIPVDSKLGDSLATSAVGGAGHPPEVKKHPEEKKEAIEEKKPIEEKKEVKEEKKPVEPPKVAEEEKKPVIVKGEPGVAEEKPPPVIAKDPIIIELDTKLKEAEEKLTETKVKLEKTEEEQKKAIEFGVLTKQQADEYRKQLQDMQTIVVEEAHQKKQLLFLLNQANEKNDAMRVGILKDEALVKESVSIAKKLHKDIKKAQERIVELDAELSKAKKSQPKDSKEIEELKRALDQARAENKQLEMDARRLAEENFTKRVAVEVPKDDKVITILEEQIKQKDEQIKRKQTEVEMLADRLKETEEKRKANEGEASDYEEKKNRLKKQLKDQEREKKHAALNQLDRTVNILLNATRNFEDKDPNEPFTFEEQYEFDEVRHAYNQAMRMYQDTTGKSVYDALDEYKDDMDNSRGALNKLKHVRELMDVRDEKQFDYDAVVDYLKKATDEAIANGTGDVDLTPLGNTIYRPEIKQIVQLHHEIIKKELAKKQKQNEETYINQFLFAVTDMANKVNDAETIQRIENVLKNPDIQDAANKNQAVLNIALVADKLRGLASENSRNQIEKKAIQEMYEKAKTQVEELTKQITIHKERPYVEGTDIQSDAVIAEFTNLLTGVYSGTISRDDAKKTARERIQQISELVINEDIKSRNYERETNVLRDKLNNDKKTLAEYESIMREKEAILKENPSEDLKAESEKLKQKYMEKAGEIYSDIQTLHERVQKTTVTRQKANMYENTKRSYETIFGEGAHAPLQIEYDPKTREETFKQSEDALNGIFAETKNIYRYSKEQLKILTDNIQALLNNIGKYSDDYTDSEKLIVDRMVNTIQSIEQIAQLPRKERVAKSTNKNMEEPEQLLVGEENVEMTDEEQEEYKRAKHERGDFAHKPEKERALKTVAETLIRRIRINTSKNKPTEITEQEMDIIKRYNAAYYRSAKQRLPENPNITLIKNTEQVKEDIKKNTLQDRIQNNLLEYANAVKEGKVDPSKMPILQLLEGNIVPVEGRQEMPPEIQQQRNEAEDLLEIQENVDVLLMNMNRLFENLEDPLVQQIAELAQEAPDEVRNALEEFVIGESVVENPQLLQQVENAIDIVDQVDQRAVMPPGKKDRRERIQTIREDNGAAVEHTMNILKQLGDAEFDPNLPQEVKDHMDGMSYDFQVGATGKDKYFTSNMFYREFMRSIPKKERGTMERAIQNINTGLQSIEHREQDHDVRYTAEKVGELFEAITQESKRNYKMWEGQEHLDELIEDLEVEMEILKFESDIIGMEGLRKFPQKEYNLNDHLGINVRETLRRLAMSGMYKFIKLFQESKI